MARLPRAREELTLRRVPSLAILGLLILAPAVLEAQEAAAPSRARRVHGYVEASPRLTRLHGETALLMGGAALLGFSPRWVFGGAGFALLDELSLDDASSPSLEVGYGGITVEWSPWAVSRAGADTTRYSRNLAFGLLAGAGNAELRDAALGTRLGSDNFAVVEPTMRLSVPLATRAAVSVAAAYRLVFSVEDLDGVGADDLRGPGLGLQVRLGPF